MKISMFIKLTHYKIRKIVFSHEQKRTSTQQSTERLLNTNQIGKKKKKGKKKSFNQKNGISKVLLKIFKFM